MALGFFSQLDEYALRHLIMNFLDGADLVKLAACRHVLRRAARVALGQRRLVIERGA
jgi:hypothetical protein